MTESLNHWRALARDATSAAIAGVMDALEADGQMLVARRGEKEGEQAEAYVRDGDAGYDSIGAEIATINGELAKIAIARKDLAPRLAEAIDRENDAKARRIADTLRGLVDDEINAVTKIHETSTMLADLLARRAAVSAARQAATDQLVALGRPELVSELPWSAWMDIVKEKMRAGAEAAQRASGEKSTLVGFGDGEMISLSFPSAVNTILPGYWPPPRDGHWFDLIAADVKTPPPEGRGIIRAIGDAVRGKRSAAA